MLNSLPSNPFATRFINPGARPFLDATVPTSDGYRSVTTEFCESIAERLAVIRRGLIVGPHGTGKSTLMHTLLPSLQQRYALISQAKYHRDPSDGRYERYRRRLQNSRRAIEMARQSSPGELFVVDGLEQLTLSGRWIFLGMLAKRGCDLLATSHHRMLAMTELYRTRMTPSLLRQLASDLIATSDDGCRGRVMRELERRDLREVTNARDLWFELYDVAAPNLTRTA